MPRSTPKRRQRGHDVLPAGFIWREGRPRWVPSPTRRRQGWRAIDLKDAWKNWLPRGKAIERAEAIASAVAAWAKGEPVAPAFIHIAPKGADLAGATKADLNPRGLGTLLDAYCGTSPDDPQACKPFRDLARATRLDYRVKLRRFVEVAASCAGLKKAEQLRALDIDILLPPGAGESGDFLIEQAYDALAEQTGAHMASGVLACVSAWLTWCVKKRRIWATNPAALVERKTPAGRIVVWEWDELAAMVKTADATGWPSIGDAIVLAVDLSWSQQDLLALGSAQISADFHVKHRRIKTSNAGNPPLLAVGRARLALNRARWKDAAVIPLHVLVHDERGTPWTATDFRHKFAEIRAIVAADLPGVAAKQFRDLRDTAITYAYEAGLDIPAICSRTLHAPDRAQAVITKHYGAIRQGLADQAAVKLDAHYAAMGYTFDALLALPAPKEGEG